MPPALRSSVRAGLLPLAALVVALLARPAGAGPAGSWQRVSPPSQFGGAITHDTSRGRLCVLGGDGSSLVHVAPDNGPPTQWSDLATAGTPPPALSGHALFYGQRPRPARGVRRAGRERARLQHDLAAHAVGDAHVVGDRTDRQRARAARELRACFDQSRGILVVFSGLDSTGSRLNNHTWQIDLNPCPRRGPSGSRTATRPRRGRIP